MQTDKDNSFVLHFVQEKRHLEIAGVTVESERVQRVKSEQLLVSLSEQSGQQNVLIAGDNVELSRDGRSLFSTLTGYPFVHIVLEREKYTVNCSVVRLVTVSTDGMRAMVNLYPPVKNEMKLTVEELLEEVALHKIRFGIDRPLLEENLRKLHEKGQPLKDRIVASGLLPIDGEDAFLRFEMEVGPVAGKVMGDGSIDFRERRMFIGVNKGELIATKVLATPGTPGTNVLGEILPAKKGKDIVVKVSDDALYFEETHEVRATQAGILSIVNDTSVKVSAKLKIDGDVDFSTGNILSNDSVEISGSVLPNFSVKTRGDVRIGGNVQAATVRSRGNIVVTTGVSGKSCRMKANGDVDINFVGRAKISAGGTIVIRKEAYYCKLLAVGDIRCAEESRVAGGVLACSGSFSGGNVGTPNAKPAVIAAGVDKKQYKRYLKIQKKIRDLEGKENAGKVRYGENEEQSPKAQKMKKMKKKLEKLRKEMSQLNLENKGQRYSAEIAVHGVLFSGTHLRIGNVQKVVDEDCCKVRCKVNRKLGEIEIKPL